MHFPILHHGLRMAGCRLSVHTKGLGACICIQSLQGAETVLSLSPPPLPWLYKYKTCPYASLVRIKHQRPKMVLLGTHRGSDRSSTIVPNELCSHWMTKLILRTKKQNKKPATHIFLVTLHLKQRKIQRLYLQQHEGRWNCPVSSFVFCRYSLHFQCYLTIHGCEI